MRNVLYGLFFVSGLAGLVYESIWSRYLGLFVGHGAYAQVIVLAVFLGGLSLGALLAGRRSEKVGHPLLWYAGAELAVGLLGLAFHDVFHLVTEAARASLFPALAGSAAFVPVKWALASSLILPPAILLGTTFPFMSAALLRLEPEEPGRTLAVLYFANSLGAAVGALVAGFLLVAWVGLPGTVLAAAVLNVLVALGAWAVWRRITAEEPDRMEAVTYTPRAWEDQPEKTARDDRALWRLLLAVSFGTAAASFIYEIAWIRMLSLVMGAATHSFELMLSAFILGLALGSFWVRRRADRFRRPMRALAWLQWLMGLAAIATLPVYMASFHWTEAILAALDSNVAGYHVFNAARYGLALAVMLPATFFAGTTLPLITRMLLTGGQGERAVGWVYGVNTLGSIVGVMAASLVLMPLIGLKALLITGAALDMLLGIVLLARDARSAGRVPRGALATLGATAVVVGAVALGTPFDRAVLNSGVYRSGRVARDSEIVYYQDGRTATVVVGRTSSGLALYTNGKVDGSVSHRWIASMDSASPTPRPMALDEPTQAFLPLVTLAHRPRAASGAVIGQGTGMSSHSLLGSRWLEELVTVEIEPAMIEGSREFYPANRRVFDDPRSRFVLDDAKSYFAGAQREFDLIVSEPSNPWVSGVSSLFTTEFYEMVSRHLAPGGVFGQWIQLYEMDDGLLLGVLAAVHRVFPSYRLFVVNGMDLLVVAGTEPALPDPDWGVFDFPGVAEDLKLTFPFEPRFLEQLRFLDRRALAPLLDGWAQPNSDYFPVLDLGAERARYLGFRADGFLWAAGPGFDPSDPFLPPTLPPSSSPLETPVPQVGVLRHVSHTSYLRAVLDGELPEDSLRDRPEARSGLYRLRRFRAALAGGEPPGDWGSWLEDAASVAALLHGSARGWADTAFYGALEAYVERWDAPEGARATVDFLAGLQARDWERVAGAMGVLGPELDRGRRWMPAELLLDGGVMAFLLTDRPGDAARLYRRLAPQTSRSAGDLRSRLLRAYLEAAAGEPEPGTSFLRQDPDTLGGGVRAQIPDPDPELHLVFEPLG